MIESIEFTNYKALRKATLPLAPFTLLLGPNGSGKTSVLQAIEGIAKIASTQRSAFLQGKPIVLDGPNWLPIPSADTPDVPISVHLKVRDEFQFSTLGFEWRRDLNRLKVDTNVILQGGANGVFAREYLMQNLGTMRTYSLDAAMIARPVQVNSNPLESNGLGLASVLDDIKDNYPERWSLLLAEFREWLPEYDHIQFVKPNPGQKAIALRTKRGGHRIPATELSQGTLVALALLTLAYLPNPPSLIGLEEIDRGLHPRLLRHLQDALYRLSYPESCGEKRPPIQVIATTHSPYLLDLYRDHPEEVVLAQKEGLKVQFQRLSDIDHFHDILGDAPLSEVWYSGIFGGVAVKP